MNNIQAYSDKIAVLRGELIASIEDIMKNNGLESLSFDEKLTSPTFVFWVSSDEFYETKALKVHMTKGELVLFVQTDNGTPYTLNKDDFTFHNLEWLDRIRKNILDTLSARKNLRQKIERVFSRWGIDDIDSVSELAFGELDRYPQTALEWRRYYILEAMYVCCGDAEIDPDQVDASIDGGTVWFTESGEYAYDRAGIEEQITSLIE